MGGGALPSVVPLLPLQIFRNDLQKSRNPEQALFGSPVFLTCAGLMQVTSTFWAATKPPLRAGRATIPNLKEEKQGYHMTPKFCPKISRSRL